MVSGIIWHCFQKWHRGLRIKPFPERGRRLVSCKSRIWKNCFQIWQGSQRWKSSNALQHGIDITGSVDQWGLIQCSLYAICDAKREKRERYFDACNLYTFARVSFQYWANKIECFLQTGQSFKAEAVDTYLPLPKFWHGMKTEETKVVVATVHKHQDYNIEWCKELRDTCHIPVKDMQHIWVCIDCAKDHPKQLNRGAPDVGDIRVGKSIPDIVVAAQAAATGAMHGINILLLKPPGVIGLEIF